MLVLTQVWSLGQEDPLAKGTATYSSILAWRIPWTEEPGGLQSMGLQTVGHNWATNTFTCYFLIFQCLALSYGPITMEVPWGDLMPQLWCGISFSKPPPYSKNYSTVPVTSKLSADSVENERCSVVSDSLWPHGLYSQWNSPGQNTGVGSLSLLQGIFPTQGSNTGLRHCKWILYQLSHQGTSRILE